MLSDLVILFLIAHVAADYYLQSSSLARRKETEVRALCLHTLIYCSAMLLCPRPFPSRDGQGTLAAAALSLGALHAAADLVKFFLTREKRERSPEVLAFLYVLDQAIHIACLVLVLSRVSYTPPLPGKILRWVLLLSVIHKPANITASRCCCAGMKRSGRRTAPAR